MEVIYVSTLVSKTKMENIINNSKTKPLQSIQKYHRLICEGFVKNNVKVKTISSIPMSRKISSKFFWNEKNEEENGVQYSYIAFINIKIIRQICIFFGTISKVLKELKNKKKKIFICDILNTTVSLVTLILSKIFNFKCIAVVTDLPRDIGKKFSISKKINKTLQNKYDGYILITQAMNEVVNTKEKPSVIIEGIVDNYVETENIEKYNEKVCIYAGGLYTKYGVKNLIDAINNIQDQNIILHLYGAGELEEYINKIKSTKIKYYGVVTNNLVVQEEKKATLLINPRFTNEEYTKYSFPSKNMEYMSTGTAVLTTKLPGMPEEYQKYVYLFEEETTHGFEQKIKEILSKPIEELQTKGNDAKKFVEKYKNNKVQTKKIMEMFESLD